MTQDDYDKRFREHWNAINEATARTAREMQRLGLSLKRQSAAELYFEYQITTGDVTPVENGGDAFFLSLCPVVTMTAYEEYKN